MSQPRGLPKSISSNPKLNDGWGRAVWLEVEKLIARILTNRIVSLISNFLDDE
jgi:hypothetical protein